MRSRHLLAQEEGAGRDVRIILGIEQVALAEPFVRWFVEEIWFSVPAALARYLWLPSPARVRYWLVFASVAVFWWWVWNGRMSALTRFRVWMGICLDFSLVRRF